jgi:hypothetical protein
VLKGKPLRTIVRGRTVADGKAVGTKGQGRQALAQKPAK